MGVSIILILLEALEKLSNGLKVNIQESDSTKTWTPFC